MNYTITPAPNAKDPPNKYDDITSYQTLTSSKVKTLSGVNTACGLDTSVWDWRGKGWLALATAHWEVLGYGDVPEEAVVAGRSAQWLVTYFTPTRFTSAGISVYSRIKEGNPEAVVRAILESLGGIENEAVRKLAGEIFEVLRN